MRTTVTIDDDIRKAIDTLRRQEGLGTSAALNELARRGLAASLNQRRQPFVQQTSAMGASRFSLDNIGEAIELLEGVDHR